MNLSTVRIEILQFLKAAKERGEPFQYMQHMKRGLLIDMRNKNLIFCSKGIANHDLDRYCITRYGEQVLTSYDTERPYFFNGSSYRTLQEMAEGEGMTVHQARYANRMGYTSKEEYAHGGAVVIGGKRYASREIARQILGYSAKYIQRLVAREKKLTTEAPKPVAKESRSSKRVKLEKAFERLGLKSE